MHATAANTLGYKKRHNQDWFDENDGMISSLLEQKRAAFVKTVGDSDPKLAQAHKKIFSKVQTELRKMQNNWWSNKADELQNLADRHDCFFYEELKAELVQAHQQQQHSEAKMAPPCSLIELQSWRDGMSISKTC